MATSKTIEWAAGAVQLTLAIDDKGVVALRSLRAAGSPEVATQSPYFTHADVPLHGVRLAGEGSAMAKTAKSLIGSRLAERIQYESHRVVKISADSEEMGPDGSKQKRERERLEVTSADAQTGLRVTQHYEVYVDQTGPAVPVVRCWATASNGNATEGGKSLRLTQLSSATVGGLTTGGPRAWAGAWTLRTATNTWFREAQWREQTLPELGMDEVEVLGLNDNGGQHQCSQGIVSMGSRGSYSSGMYLPMALLTRRDGGNSWFWQIEHNGSWRWEVADYRDAVYAAIGGPNGADHGWAVDLAPGQSVTSVPVALGRVDGDATAAFGALTTYRRAMRRPHEDMDRCPIIFNDYMNCLMGDPTEAKILGLLDYAAAAGAEYFVIDAGWYADDSGHWWDEVGLWEPSPGRFPSGLRALLDRIRAAGLVPGLWLEPEVVGIRCPMAHDGTLPEEAYFHDHGVRVDEKGRYQLDFRHPAVIERMTRIVDGLINDYGAGYFKLDYNIEILQGTDTHPPGTVDPGSPGAAHLEHLRAYLAWIRSLLDRHPGLVIESCSSGGMRCDYAQLALQPLHSTSDQQDPILYAAIAAAAPTAVTPEQGAVWAYPQACWDDEINAMTVANSLLGRVHLSGRLDQLAAHQSELVRDGMRVYAEVVRPHLPTALPFWPLGLPRWGDEWVSLGMAAANGLEAFVLVWRRGRLSVRDDGKGKPEGPGSIGLSLPGFGAVELLYPKQLATDYALADGVLRVTFPKLVGARLFHLKK